MSALLRKHPLATMLPTCFFLLFAAACRGVLQLEVNRVDPESPARLGVLAYVQGGDIWVADLDTGVQLRVTRDGRNRRPSLSAGGHWVAYLKGDYLFAADLRTGEEIQVSGSGVADFAWSPVGERLAFPAHPGLLIWEAEERAFEEIGWEEGAVNRLAWSPDGLRLAFDTLEGGSPTVWVVTPVGIEQRAVYTSAGLMDVPRLAGWAEDNAHLALWIGSRAAAAEQDGLPLCLGFAGGSDPWCLPEIALLKPDFLDWSADRLVFVSGGGRETWVGKSLAAVAAGGGEMRLLVSSTDQSPVFPAWSPNGELVAYSAGVPVPLDHAYDRQEEALQSRRIWIVDPVNGRKVQLTADSGYRDERPLWSSDGRHILFVRLSEESASLWLVESDGIGLRLIVDELTPLPDSLGEYGYIDWREWWDWRRPEGRPQPGS